MVAPAGFAGQFGYKSESTWGTPVTVDKFLPILSEGVKQNIARLESKGIRAGRRTTAKWKAGAKTVGGPVELELCNTSIAALLKLCFGAVTTTGVGPYTHSITPGDLTGDSATVQFGRPDTGGTVRAFTYDGVKVASWELSCAVGEIAKLALEVSAESEDTATALAVASYASTWETFTFVEGDLKIATVSVATIKELAIGGDNKLATERHFIGTSTVKEQLENGEREYTGSLTAEFESLTAYNRFVNGTEAALDLTFTAGTHSLSIDANVRFDGETPTLAGMEILEQALPFKCLHATSDASAITLTLINDEASAA